MGNEKKRINAVIDTGLYLKVMGLGYGISEAVVRGFEKLLKETDTQKARKIHQSLMTSLSLLVRLK